MKEQFQILYYCSSRSWGGAEMSAVKLAHQMAQRGHGITFVARPDSRIIRELDASCVDIVPLKVPSGFGIPALIRFRSIIQKKNIQLIHCHRSGDLGLLWVMSMFGKLPPVVLDRQVSSKIKKKDLYHRCVYHLVSKVFVLSRYLERNMLDTTPIAPGKLVVIPGGIRLESYVRSAEARERIRSEWGISPSSIVIGCVSRIDEQKGLMDLTHAFAKLVQRVPSVCLVIVGEPTVGEPAFAENLHRQVAQLGISKEILFAGYRSDIPQVLSAFDIFALPSYEESFGYVFIEAMAAGLPVVTTNAGGVPEIVEDGVTGILCVPKKAEEIYRALEKLVLQKELREKMGIAGRQRVELHFLEQYLIDAIEKEYRTLSSATHRE
jgi:glycosyltransferase involved in cell wall biosynthesis